MTPTTSSMAKKEAVSARMARSLPSSRVHPHQPPAGVGVVAVDNEPVGVAGPTVPAAAGELVACGATTAPANAAAKVDGMGADGADESVSPSASAPSASGGGGDTGGGTDGAASRRANCASASSSRASSACGCPRRTPPQQSSSDSESPLPPSPWCSSSPIPLPSGSSRAAPDATDGPREAISVMVALSESEVRPPGR
jgi:hypothetical protein